MDNERNPLIEFNLQELNKLIEIHKDMNESPYMLDISNKPVKVWCDSELTYMELQDKIKIPSNGKSTILHHFWEQKLLKTGRITKESIKLLLESNPKETNELRIKLKTAIEENERNRRRRVDELQAKSWGDECDFIIETWKPDSKIVNVITSPIHKTQKKDNLK